MAGLTRTGIRESVRLELLRSTGRFGAASERHDPVRAEEQDREQGALLRAAEPDRVPGLGDLDGTVDAELEQTADRSRSVAGS